MPEIRYIDPDPRVPWTVEQHRKHENQNKVLNLLMSGMTRREAGQIVGVALTTIEKWRSNDNAFREASDLVMRTRFLTKHKPDDIPDKEFVGFRKKYFGFDSPPVHIEIADQLEHSDLGSINMVLIPPFFGKTTIITDWCCYAIAQNPNIRILYVSETSKLAAKVLGRIKRRMIEPRITPEYQEAYGPFYSPGQERIGKPWTDSFITVFQSDHDEQDYTFEATGWDSQIYGIRSDLIILDDFQTLRRSSPDVTEKMLERFQQDIITRIDQTEGRIVIVGTRVAQKDFYIQLIDQEIIDKPIVRPALDFRGRSLWPDKWPVEALETQKKRVGPKVWARAYMMTPAEDGSATFDEPTVNDCKRDDLALPVPVASDTDVWAGIDPAIDGYTALCAASISYDHMRLLRMERYLQLATGEAILDRIYTLWERTKFTRLHVEAVSFQKALARDERLDAMRRACGFVVVEHQTNRNKNDETFGVARMASSFIAGEVEIPWGDEVTRNHFEWWVRELLDWRATIPARLRVQDGVMAFWFVWLRWQQFRASQRNTQGHRVRSEGMPYKPTMYKPLTGVSGSPLRRR